MARGWLALAALLMLAAAPAQRATTFRSGVHTVVLHATVRGNDGRLAPDLTRDDFEVRDENRTVAISTFSSDPQPITVALLLDMSGSMERHFLRVRSATQHFIDALKPEDRARIGTFGTEIALSPWLTGDKRILKRVLNEEVWPGGGTPLWGAVYAAMRSLDGEAGRRVVLTLTDGVGGQELPGRSASTGKVRSKADDDGFMVYAIGMEGSPLDGGITQLAERTGGGHFKVDKSADLSSTFVRVVDELRHQYLIGFTPPKTDGRLHDVEVRVTKPDMTVRARKNYRAPGGQ